MLKSSFHCERFIFLSGLKKASAQLFIAFMVVAACDLYMGRNISAKGRLLMEGADDTALSLEHLHEIGSEKGKAVCKSLQNRQNIPDNEDLAFALGIRQLRVLC